MKTSGLPWLGDIPAGWEIRRNGRLFAQRNETGFPELPILEVSLRTGVRVRDFDASSRKQVMADRDKYKRAVRGDIAYNMMRMWQGAVDVVPVDGLISPAYVVARPFAGTVSRYFAYLYRTDAYKGEVDNYSRGIVKDRNRLYWEAFKQIPTPYPPPDEQAAVVRFIDHADRRIWRYIRAKQKLIKLLVEQKRAIIHRAVTRGLDPNVRLKPSGVKWLGDVPEHWEIWQVGHFAAIGNGSTPSRGNTAYWSGGTYPWLNSSSVNVGIITASDQFVTEMALRECHLPRVPKGSVLVAITGQGKTRGTAAVLMIEATINQHIAFITPRTRESTATAEFLRAVLVAAYSELRRISDESGSTKGALTCEDLRHFRVALPPVEEQQEIVQWARDATAEVEAMFRLTSSKISLLQEYRTRLIADVVTGKLDVRDAAARLPDEVEEPEPFDEADALTDAEYDAAEDLDAALEEAEA